MNRHGWLAKGVWFSAQSDLTDKNDFILEKLSLAGGTYLIKLILENHQLSLKILN